MSKDKYITTGASGLSSQTTSDCIEDFAYKSGVAVGDMVKVSSDGTLSLASSSDVPIGAVFETTAGSSTRVITQGVIESVLSSATPGTSYYLSSSGSSGNTISYSSTSNTQVGFAKSASDLFVKITTTSFGSAADSKAVLTLTSTTKGLLPPRMTPTQRDAISSPPAGLMVYDTTNNEPNYYNGSAWKQMDGTSAGSSVSYASVDVWGSSSYSFGGSSGWSDDAYACGYGNYHSTTPQTNQNWYRAASPTTPEQLYSNSSGTAVGLMNGQYYYRIIGGSAYKYFVNGNGQVYSPSGTAIQIDNTELTAC